MTVINFTPRPAKKREEDKHYVQRLDEAYDQLTDYFTQMLRDKYAKDDIAILAMIKLAADVVRVGRDRPVCGDEWAKGMIECFVARVNQPSGESGK